jgi:hypothetical protein
VEKVGGIIGANQSGAVQNCYVVNNGIVMEGATDGIWVEAAGGDYFMMNSLYKALNGEEAEGITYLDVSIESHLMSFAAEESRLHNGATYPIKK